MVSVIAVARTKIKNVADGSVPDTGDGSPEVVESPTARLVHLQDNDTSNETRETDQTKFVDAPRQEQSIPPPVTGNDAVYGDGEDRSSSREESPQPQSRRDYV